MQVSPSRLLEAVRAAEDVGFTAAGWVWTRPDEPPPLLEAAVSVETAR